MKVDGDLAHTLATAVSAGSLEAAARRLFVTPSAISQRIRALEAQVGRPVLHRTRPVEVTAAGAAVVRFARQLELLADDLRADLEVAPSRTPLTVVVNADSLHTWALPPLVAASEDLELEILREDEAHSLTLLRSGAAAGAVTSVATAVTGCTVERLGVMRYLAVCSPHYVERWFATGLSPAALADAPVVTYDRKDDLQQRCLRRLTRTTIDPPTHLVPASAEYAEAIRLGLGWGMVPEIECREEVRTGELRHLDDRAALDVPLFWQQWRRGSGALRAVGDALRAAAVATLR